SRSDQDEDDRYYRRSNRFEVRAQLGHECRYDDNDQSHYACPELTCLPYWLHLCLLIVVLGSTNLEQSAEQKPRCSLSHSQLPIDSGHSHRRLLETEYWASARR